MDSIIHRVARHADIDTRRALGIYGKLPKISIKKGPTEIWRYWPAEKKAIFFNPDPLYYEFEVHNGLVFDGEFWKYIKNSHVRTTTINRDGGYFHFEFKPKYKYSNFSFGLNPEFIDKN
jgi:hypothetical protein